MPNVGNGNITSFYCAQNVRLHVRVLYSVRCFWCCPYTIPIYTYTSSLTKFCSYIQNTHYRCRHWPLNVDLARRHSHTAAGEKSANGILCRHARSIFYLSYELFIRHGVYVCKHSTKINVCYFEFKLCFHIAIQDGVLVKRC